MTELDSELDFKCLLLHLLKHKKWLANLLNYAFLEQNNLKVYSF